MKLAVFGLGYVGCVTAACFARDGHHVMMRLDLHRLHVDDGILPDLRIDEAIESKREQAFEQSTRTDRLAAMNGISEEPACMCPGTVAGICGRHVDSLN